MGHLTSDPARPKERGCVLIADMIPPLDALEPIPKCPRAIHPSRSATPRLTSLYGAPTSEFFTPWFYLDFSPSNPTVCQNLKAQTCVGLGTWFIVHTPQVQYSCRV